MKQVRICAIMREYPGSAVDKTSGEVKFRSKLESDLDVYGVEYEGRDYLRGDEKWTSAGDQAGAESKESVGELELKFRSNFRWGG